MIQSQGSRYVGIAAGAIALLALSWGARAAPLGGEPGQTAPGGYEIRRASQVVFRSIVDRVRPSLVRIDTVGGTQPRAQKFVDENKENLGDEDPSDENDGMPPERKRRSFVDSPGSDFVIADGSTTGLVYSADGYIITSSFNFARDPALISVVFADGRRLAADLIARDAVRKLAVLKVDAVDLPVPEWAGSDAVHVGQWAVALGLGFGGDTPSVTVGIVSALNRMRGNAIQTDAKLSPVNYGGPLCDIAGRVVGLCVPMAQRSGELAGVELYDSGVGFAVPRHRIRAITPELMSGKSFYRGWLGISVSRRSRGSLLISNVAVPSPMHDRGILPGDRILWAENRRIKHFDHLRQTLYMIPAGEDVYLSLRRGDREFSTTVTLAKNDDLGPLPEARAPFDPHHPFPPWEKQNPYAPPRRPKN